jgi:hypothetical protein
LLTAANLIGRDSGARPWGWLAGRMTFADRVAGFGP